MDINQWLDDAVAAGRPTQSRPIVTRVEAVADAAGNRNPAHDQAREKLRRHRRSTSPSSFLEPEESSPKRNRNGLHRVKTAENVVCEPMDDSSSAMAMNELDRDMIDPYRRKKRHKTRAGKYEPKSKRKRQADTNGSLSRRQPQKQSGSRRAGKTKVIKGKTAAAVVQTFKAPNVQRERITLNHGINPGLFRKGRAGSPFRGRGMPDLVLSEMKFLQKRNGLHDAATLANNARGGRSRAKLRQDEEDISAYFTSARPPSRARDIERAHWLRKHHTSEKDRLQIKNVRCRTSEPEPVPLSNDVHGNVSLLKHKDPPSGTYYSWSTSVEPMMQKHRPMASSRASHTAAFNLGQPLAQKFARHKIEEVEGIGCSIDGAQRIGGIRSSSVPNDQGGARSKVPSPIIRGTDIPDKAVKKPAYTGCVHRSVAKTSDMTTESLPLPSTPPQIDGQLLEHDQMSLKHESQSLLAPRGFGAQQDWLISSSTPLHGLLADCNAAFQRSKQVDFEASEAEGIIDYDQMDSGETYHDDAHGNAGLGQTYSSIENIRRLWRTHTRLRPVSQSYAAPIVARPAPFHLTFNQKMQSDFDHAIDYSEGVDNGGDADVGLFAMVGYRDNVYTGLELTGERSEERSEDGEFREAGPSFWQPNILY